MRKPFQFPLMQGTHSHQAHVKIPEGTYEEEIGREGFFGPATHLYHQNPPTDWVEIQGECRPQAWDFNNLKSDGKNWICKRMLFNNHVTIATILATGSDPTYNRNADGDEIQFIHEGSGRMESDFGILEFNKGDYIYIPRGSTYRFLSTSKSQRLVIENRSNVYEQPDRGILGQHALYDPAVLKVAQVGPSKEGPTDTARNLWEIRVKRADRYTSIFYKRNPLDVVGMKGDLTVFSLSMKDIRPVMSHRAHLAPSVHSTFIGKGFVICSFVPRPLEEDEDAQRVPFFHRNVDYDEVIFYHAGDFFSRDNIRPGWMTFHPTGVHHGPHPKALANQRKKTHTDEYAVMIDAREPLQVDTDAGVGACEFKDYWKSWMGV